MTHVPAVLTDFILQPNSNAQNAQNTVKMEQFVIKPTETAKRDAKTCGLDCCVLTGVLPDACNAVRLTLPTAGNVVKDAMEIVAKRLAAPRANLTIRIRYVKKLVAYVNKAAQTGYGERLVNTAVAMGALENYVIGALVIASIHVA